MSGFAPLLRLAASAAAPALLLAAMSGHAMGQTAYAPASSISANLMAGGMSRLAAISAQQGGTVPPSWVAQPITARAIVTGAIITEAIVNERRINDFIGKLPGWQLQGVQLSVAQPALNYRQPNLMPAFMRDFAPAPAIASPQRSSFVMPSRPVPALLGHIVPRSGQPDVFGSVAMPVSRTLLDGKWASVAGVLPGRGIWSGLVQAARGVGRQQQAEMINNWVNRRLRFVDDRLGGDNWASAARTLQSGMGDCEDYAIAKMKLLEAAGFDRHAMFLVIARDLVRQADHAVLAVRIDDELMILDNMTGRVLPSSSVGDYRPIMSFNAYGRWTHGYRVTPPQKVQFAAR